MGCSPSMIDNGESILRCNERRILMNVAVTARNRFAAAHSAYSKSLKNTGAALSDYAHGEIQNPQFGTGATKPNCDIASAAAAAISFKSFPPPPLPNFSSPLQRAATVPEMNMYKPDLKPGSPIMEEEEENENEASVGALRRRRSNKSNGDEGSSRIRKSELNENLAGTSPPVPPIKVTRHIPPPQQHNSTFDYFFSVDNVLLSTLGEVEEVHVNKEEILHKPFDKKSKGVDSEDIEGRRMSGKAETVKPVVEKLVEPPPAPPAVAEPAAAVKSSKTVKLAGSSGSSEGKKIFKANINLLQIFLDLDDHFLKSSESAHEVSKMLEATRLHYHSNFADNRDIAEEQETHATVVDKLLAWETKLYDEVKAGKLMKLEYQNKIATLNRLQKRDSNAEASDKVTEAVRRLENRYAVHMESLGSIISKINHLRDKQLYPKLVHLINGMATMWETMRVHHEGQLKIVNILRSVNPSQFPKETSGLDYERTLQLCDIVGEWHSQFEKLVRRQKDYIEGLSSWLKLNLVPIESSLKEKVSSPPRVQIPPIQRLLLAWHDQLKRLPDEHLRTSICTFRAVINNIRLMQEKEMELRIKWEETAKELERKERHCKYQQRRMPDGMDPEKTIVVEKLKTILEEEKKIHARQCLHVREKSLVSLKNQLPELFRALSQFSFASSEMYQNLKSICRV